jgi:hypothetical protein
MSGCSAKAQTVQGQRKPSTSGTAFSSWMHLIFMCNEARFKVIGFMFQDMLLNPRRK